MKHIQACSDFLKKLVLYFCKGILSSPSFNTFTKHCGLKIFLTSYLRNEWKQIHTREKSVWGKKSHLNPRVTFWQRWQYQIDFFSKC